MKFISGVLKKTRFHINFHISKLGRESFIAVGGIALEYYALFHYGYSAKVILHYFFGQSSPLIIYSAMLLSYIIGPLGAIICGDIGDIKGRKKILVWTLAFVAIPSFLISILPSYSQIGVTASILFIILRTIQTLAFGGDTLGLVTFVLEEAPAEHRGLFGGFMSMGSGIGVFLACLAVSILDPLDYPDSPWRWQVPLSFGIFGVLFSIYFYRTIGETETFKHYKKTHYINSWPFIDLFRKNKLNFLKIVGLTSLAPIITIVIFGFIPNLDIAHLKLSHKFSMLYNTVALAVFICFAPVFGALSDKIGRKPILLCVNLIFIFFGFPLFYILNYADAFVVFVIQLFFSLVASAYYGITFAVAIENFSTHVRYTGVALGYYTTYALFGGVNGLFIVNLLAKEPLDIAPVFYLLFGSIISLVSLLFLKDRRNDCRK